MKYCTNLSTSFEMFEDITDAKDELSLTSAPEKLKRVSTHLYPVYFKLIGSNRDTFWFVRCQQRDAYEHRHHS